METIKISNVSVNKKRRIIWIMTAALFIIGTAYVAMNYSRYGNKKTSIKIKDQTIRVEIVTSQKKMTQGLSGRDGICDQCGMLFLFDKKGSYRIWMKDMKFDLDIIWIEGDSIVSIKRNISSSYPDIMRSESVADKVLEVPSGFCDKHEIHVGDGMEL